MPFILPDGQPDPQTALQRARSDVMNLIRDRPVAGAFILGVPGLGCIPFADRLWPNIANGFLRTTTQIAAFGAGLVGTYLLLLFMYWVAAPANQRDEARAWAATVRRSSEGEPKWDDKQLAEWLGEMIKEGRDLLQRSSEMSEVQVWNEMEAWHRRIVLPLSRAPTHWSGRVDDLTHAGRERRHFRPYIEKLIDLLEQFRAEATPP